MSTDNEWRQARGNEPPRDPQEGLRLLYQLALKENSEEKRKAWEAEKLMLKISCCMYRDERRQAWVIDDQTAAMLQLDLQSIKALSESKVSTCPPS